MNNNLNVDIQYGLAKNCATSLMDNVNKMRNIINTLEDMVNNMTWSGSNATNFKNTIARNKAELDDIYNNYLAKIPAIIDQSVQNYQKYEG